MNAETFNNFHGAQELKVEDIQENVIVIKINRTYTMGQSPEDIKDYVRGHWRINTNRAKKAKYIFALFRGWIVGVYEIEQWYSSTEKTDMFPQPENLGDPKLANRKYCTCRTVNSDSIVGKRYLYKMIHEFSKSTQNPISYIEPSINSKSNQNFSLLSMQKNCLKKCIPFLQNIYDNVEKRKWCENYSVNSQNSNDLWKLESQIHLLMHEIYDSGLVPSDYKSVYDTILDDLLYARLPEDHELLSLTDDQVQSCIAMELRHDHFNEGVLINTYISKGILLKFMKELLSRIEHTLCADKSL